MSERLRKSTSKEEAENQAYKIEAAGKTAAAAVRRGLFMSAEKLTARRNQEYKAAVRHRLSVDNLQSSDFWANDPNDDEDDFFGPDSGYR